MYLMPLQTLPPLPIDVEISIRPHNLLQLEGFLMLIEVVVEEDLLHVIVVLII